MFTPAPKFLGAHVNISKFTAKEIKMKRLSAAWKRIIALILAGLFVLMATMSGTMAWADFTQHRTNIMEGDGPHRPSNALLQKFEADSETPIPNTEFGLFRVNADGTATLVRTFVTGADGKILASELEPGEYYWQETRPAPGFLSEIEDGQPKKYHFTLPTEDGEPPLIVVYNSRQLGSLTVTKTVAGEGGDLNREFEFTVIIGGQTETFTLRHGQSRTFDDIPVGTFYEVVETPVAGYVTTSVNHAGNVPAGGITASFTNTFTVTQPQTGSLTVTKTVTGESANPQQEFEFTAVIGGVEHTFTLRHGQSRTFNDIPIGTNYTVTEIEIAGWIAIPRQYSGTILIPGVTITLPFVNHYEGDDPPDEPGNLEITKTVIGTNSEQEFSFTITFSGEGAPNSPQTFTLRHGEIKRFEDIPAGVTFIVTETDSGDYLPDFTSASGVIAAGQTSSVHFINRKPGTGDDLYITVTKIVQGNPPLDQSEKLFYFTLKINDTEHEFELRAGETSEQFPVQTGDVFHLVEDDYTADGYMQSGVVNGSGTVGNVSIQVIQDNTYVGPELIDIEGEKTWQAPANAQLPASVTIRLMNGNVIVRSATISATNNWQYSFTNLPKYDAMGNVINYTVEEVRIPGWRPVRTGYDIKNHPQAPITDDAIEVEKAIVGTPPEDIEFKFVLTPVNNAPMPANSEVTITGAGEASFGQITYTMPGIFTYTITEIAGNLPNWSYDASVYTLTVTVTENANGQLTISRALTKAGQPAEKALFTNTYNDSGETISVKVTKVWQGEGPHPQSVQVQLYRDGTAFGSPSSLSAANNWTRTWTGLDKGHTWTVDEPNVPAGYTKTVSGDAVNGFTITNTRQTLPPGTIRVIKAWAGEGPHPQNVQVQLYRDGTAHGDPVMLNAANNWTHTWTDLPAGTWTVDEPNVPEGYTKSISGSAVNGFTIANTRQTTLPPSSIRVTKAWAGQGPHPQDVQVQLYRDGTAHGAPVMLDAANNWTHTWIDLPTGTWTVDEPNVPAGYTKSISGSASSGFTITNTRTGEPGETTSVKVTKVWAGEDPNWPASVAMQLFKDGVATGVPVTLNATNNWTYTWQNLERGPAWTADEVHVPPGYIKAVTGDAANGFVVTNTKTGTPQEGDEITLSGRKTWNHGANPEAQRPDAITLLIKADGVIVQQRRISAAENWAWSFTLPKYDGEREIKYTVDEAAIENYVKTVDGFNLINTYCPDGGTPGKPGPGTPPKTDDESNLALWLTLMGLSLGGLAAVIIISIKWRKRREEELLMFSSLM